MGEKQLTNDTYKLDAIVNEILMPGNMHMYAPTEKKRGRRRKSPSPTWALDFYNPAGNRSFALISMCIKDNLNQSIDELALRVAKQKSVSPASAMQVLLDLKERGLLGYYDDKTLHFIKWKETEATDELENTRN